MASLLQDIKTQSDWITKAFAADKINLDYSIHSLIEIDIFFNRHAKDGKVVKGGRLAQNLGSTLFSIGAYVGETIIKNVPDAIWQTEDNDPHGELNVSVKLPGDVVIFPVQRIMKRFQNGAEDAVYIYGHHIIKDYIAEPFDQSFWQLISEENKSPSKPRWRFW